MRRSHLHAVAMLPVLAIMWLASCGKGQDYLTGPPGKGYSGSSGSVPCIDCSGVCCSDVTASIVCCADSVCDPSSGCSPPPSCDDCTSVCCTDNPSNCCSDTPCDITCQTGAGGGGVGGGSVGSGSGGGINSSGSGDPCSGSGSGGGASSRHR